MTLARVLHSIHRDASAPPPASSRLHSLFRHAMVAPIGLYRVLISPVLFGHYGPACRFDPPCSVYARDAILRHGPRRGLALGLRRLFKCRPGGGFGYDPVPLAQVPASVARA
jgi:hypothetical protein